MNVFEIIQLIGMLPILAIIGDPLRHYVFSRSALFRDLNLIQILLLDFFIGGSILYLIAIIPAGIFGALIPFILPVSFILFLYIHKEFLTRIIRSKFSFRLIGKQGVYTFLLLLGVFLTIFLIRVYVQSHFVFGPNGDQAFHSLVVRKIMDQGSIAYTLEPYVIRYTLPDSPLQYQQGLHVILAYVASIFNWTAPNAVRLADMLFQSLGVLGGYYLGKKALNSDVYGLMFGFIFGFISRWPKTMPWGSNAFTLGFPLFLIIIAALIFMWKKGISRNDVVPMGLLIGFLGAIHPTYLFVVVLAMAFMLITRRIPIHRFFFVGLIVFVFISPVVITRVQDLYNAIPEPSGLSRVSQSLRNAVTGDWISYFPFMRYLILLLLPAGVVWLFIRKKDEQVRSFINVTTIIIFSGIVIFLLSSLSFSGLSLPQLPFFQLHFGIIYNSLLFFSGLLMGDIIIYLLGNLNENKPEPKIRVRKLLVGFTILLMLAPFIYYGGIEETSYLMGQERLFNAMTPDDLALIDWMQENFPVQTKVLVHRFEGGNYLASLAGYRTIFNPTTTTSSLDPDYVEIVKSIGNGSLTPELFKKLESYGFNYLWVGSAPSPQLRGYNWPAWSSDAIRANPNFKLVKSVGKSCLFKIEISDPHALFVEDFQENSLKYWELVSGGEGEGAPSIISYNGGTALEVKVQKAETARFFSLYLHRYLNVGSSNVTLNFKVDFDVSAPNIYVYDTKWNRRIDIPIRGPGKYSVDISKLWNTSYDSHLPAKIIIQLITRSTGVQNTAIFDYITIRTQQ
jgi:hypothetical protein